MTLSSLTHSRYKNLIIAGFLAAITGSAAAQESEQTTTEKTKTEQPEKIEVTGSRIKRIDIEGATPVTVFTRDDMERSGQVSVADFLRSSNPNISLSSENATLQDSGGTAAFSSRGFASSYTLVLINGRRLPTNAISRDFADINQIPLAAIERIEYLSDGASAIYGSDAVAGVVNIITKKNYNGTSVSAQYGQAYDGQGKETSHQIVRGIYDEKGSMLFAYDYFKREPIKAKDRPIINSGISPEGDDQRSPTGIPGYVQVAQTDSNGVVLRNDDGSIKYSPFQAWDDCKSPSPYNDGTTCLYDYAPLYEVQPFSERQSFFTYFDYKINEDLMIFGEGRYTRATTITRNGAAPGSVFMGANTPTDEEYAEYASILGVSIEALKQYSPNNPYGKPIKVGRRYLDFGPRTRENRNETISGVIGLKGTIAGEHEWELAVSRAYTQNLQVGAGGQVNEDAASAAFSSGVLDPFSENVFDTEEKLAARKAIDTNMFRQGNTELKTVDFVISGPISGAMLPGGEIGYAGGLSGRLETFFDKSDRISEQGKILGGSSGNGAGKREARAAFIELNFPILSELELSLATRYDDLYSVGKASTYKGSIAYRPIQQLLFRTSYGTGFKAPDLHDLYLGAEFGSDVAKDTKVCEAAENDPQATEDTIAANCGRREVNIKAGGNPDLEPETSKSLNFGIVSQPIENLSIGLDYWSIEVNNQIGRLGAQELLNNESEYPELVVRDSNGGFRENDGFIFTRIQNITKAKSAGLDLSTTFTSKSSIGVIASTLQLSKMLEIKRQTSDVQPLCDTAKNYSFDGIINTRWSLDKYSSNLQIDYRGAYDAYDPSYVNKTCDYKDPASKYKVKQHVELAMQFGYQLPWGSDMLFGINNVTNEKPAFDPYVADGWPFYDQGIYRNTGRFMYAKMSHNF